MRKSSGGANTRVISFGSNFNKQLGYDEGVENKVPRIVNGPPNLIKIQAGWNATVAINEDGSPYLWGATPVKYNGKSKYSEPTPLYSISESLRLDRRVMQFAAGRGHLALLTDDGVVFTCGQGEWGKLGHGNTTDLAQPTPVRMNGKVTQIGVGDQHTVLLTDGGQVFTFGQGIYGQLGHSSRSDRTVPHRIEAFVRTQQTIVSIGVGYDQTFAINADGVVFAWGRQGPWLGIPDAPDHVQQPQEIILLKQKAKIAAVAVGKQHTLLLTVDGKVYSMGTNKDGRLGHGKTVKKETANPLQIAALNNLNIIQIAAGEKHSVVLTDDGSVLTFGSGSSGRLGHGDTKNQDVPRAVQGIFEKACAIAAGFEHTIVLTGQLPSEEDETSKPEKKKDKKKSSLSSKNSRSSKLSSKSSKLSSKASKARKGEYDDFTDSTDTQAEDDEMTDSSKRHRKLSKRKGKLDRDVEEMLKELGLLEAAPLFLKAGITWPVLLQFKKDDLEELGLELGQRVAISNFIQAAKNKFKVGEASSIKATIDSKDLVFAKKLGEGNFGDVWQGKLRGTTTVAIKTIRSEDKSAFLLEAHIMAQLPAHPNVVTFFGLANNDEKNELYLVTEYVADGSLDRYLTENIGKVGTQALIQMTQEVAAGCDHLCAHGIVHRDLAARNLLLEIKRGGEHHVKVCDFGLSRGLVENEYNSQMKNVPVRWTAPEAFKFRKYTSKSDVWSFGVTAWEIFSFGQTPYTGMSPVQVVKALDSGYRLPRPEFCPKKLYEEIICKCLSMDPNERPTFNELYKRLEELYPNGQISEEELQELRTLRKGKIAEIETKEIFVVEKEYDSDEATGEYSSNYTDNKLNSEYALVTKREQRQTASNGSAAAADKPKKKKKKSKKDPEAEPTSPKSKNKKKKKSKENKEKESQPESNTPRSPKKKSDMPVQYAEGWSMELVPTDSSVSPLASPTSKKPANSLGMSHAELKGMSEYAS